MVIAPPARCLHAAPRFKTLNPQTFRSQQNRPNSFLNRKLSRADRYMKRQRGCDRWSRKKPQGQAMNHCQGSVVRDPWHRTVDRGHRVVDS
ncbi:hypothetical protein V490_08478 [Pseudogymnoascus sp. VKM F-3557]|nr:hypothetical protein V490_08478 [Pseudogymnoascus sp. VKM F-3557]